MAVCAFLAIPVERNIPYCGEDMHRDQQLALHRNLAEVLWTIGSTRESAQMAIKVEQ